MTSGSQRQQRQQDDEREMILLRRMGSAQGAPPRQRAQRVRSGRGALVATLPSAGRRGFVSREPASVATGAPSPGLTSGFHNGPTNGGHWSLLASFVTWRRASFPPPSGWTKIS